MTPEKEAELFAKLDLMLELYRRMQEDIKDLRGDMRDVRADVKAVGERVSRVEGRIEEQSKFLQLALAGRQTRKPAA